ncbi:MAG: ParB/RepB/Spo0J family partition protein, partial [Clostridium sp.]
SVRDLERLIKKISSEPKDEKEIKEESPYYTDVKDRLQDYFGTKVNINSKPNKKGKIEIEYYSDEDLNRILDLMNM